tara:strand:+ start:192 stop:686 length:495 start_codon:yes stop_codon:yes gene_type:complete
MTTKEQIEKISFKLELYSTYWNQPPVVEIFLNDTSQYKQEITGTEKNPTVINFTENLIADKKYLLTLQRTGKSKGQTIVNDKGDILKDQLLHIKSIEIDEIDLGALVFEGLYTPVYPEPWHSQQVKNNTAPPKSIKNSTSMGHDGTWTLAFESPFYMWLLENLY